MTEIFRGDDADDIIAIDVIENTCNVAIAQIVVQIGTICKVYDYPSFPLHISLDRSETTRLNSTTRCFVAIINDHGKKTTANGHFWLRSQKKVVSCSKSTL